LDSNDLASALAYAEGTPASVPSAIGAKSDCEPSGSACQRESQITGSVVAIRLPPPPRQLAAHKRRQTVEPGARSRPVIAQM